MAFFFDRLLGRGKRVIPPNAAFMLTERGKDKLQEFGGDPKSRILVTLETRGSSDVDEISQASGLSRGQIERFIPTLLKGGYIQFVTGGGSGLDDI
jgi:Fic family protein